PLRQSPLLVRARRRDPWSDHERGSGADELMGQDQGHVPLDPDSSHFFEPSPPTREGFLVCGALFYSRPDLRSLTPPRDSGRLPLPVEEEAPTCPSASSSTRAPVKR